MSTKIAAEEAGESVGVWQRRLYRLVVVVAASAGLAALVGWLIARTADSMFTGPDNHVAATDSRVCPGSQNNNLSLDDALNAFVVSLPKNAKHVVFTAGVNTFFGTHSLWLRFTTTPTALHSFLAAGHFPPPSADTQPVNSFTEVGCGLDPTTLPHILYSNGGKWNDVTVAVDLSDPAAPMVWINGIEV